MEISENYRTVNLYQNGESLEVFLNFRNIDFVFYI